MPRMDLLAIAKAERAKLDRVIALLEELPKTGMLSSPQATKPSTSTGQKRTPHRWTAAQKKAMSLKQKALWAAKKKGKKA
jgi:hypothetical protein